MNTQPPPAASQRSNSVIGPTSASDFAPYVYWLLALVFTLLSTLLQIRALSYGEVIDDHDLLHSVDQRGCGTNPAACFQHPLFLLYYRPMMTASFSLGVALHGTRPAWFHLENLLLHTAVIALAFWFFRLLFRRDAPALVAGMLFSLHPLHVCVTTFIGGRTDTLALFFLFWFAIGLLKSGPIWPTAEDEDQGPEEALQDYPLHASPRLRAGHLLWRAVSVLGFGAALFTKEQCALLVLLAPLLASWTGAPGRRLVRAWMALYAIPILLYGIAASRIARFSTMAPANWSVALHIEMIGRTLWYYVKAFFFPTVHTIHQSTLGPWDMPQPLIALLGYICAGLWLALLWRVWPDRALRVLALWTTLMLLPCLNFIPIPSQFIASYRAVLPLVGVAGLAGAALEALSNRWRLGTPARRLALIVAPIAAVLAWGTLADVPAWKSDFTLMIAETQADPNFLPAFSGLANAWRMNEHNNQKALETYDPVVAQMFPGARTTEERVAQGRTPAFRHQLKSWSGLRYEPAPYIDLVARGRGGVCQMLGLYDRAIEDYRLALAFQPDDVEVLTSLVFCCNANGRMAEAAEAQRTLLQYAPTSQNYAWLGYFYTHIDRWTEARDALAEAMKRAPANAPPPPFVIRLYEDAVRHAGPSPDTDVPAPPAPNAR